MLTKRPFAVASLRPLCSLAVCAVVVSSLSCDRHGGDGDAGSSSSAPASGATGLAAGAPLPQHFAGLAPGRYLAVHFRMAVPRAVADIQKRFVAATKKNAKWMAEHAKKHNALKPGAPLPYHEKFGISQAEYAQLMAAYEQQKPIEQERLPLTIRHHGGMLRFDVGGALAPLNGVGISAAGDLRYGNVRVKSPRAAQAINGRLGAWSGHYWTYRDTDPDARRMNALEFELGTALASGRRFVHFRRKRFDGKKMREDFDLLAWIEPPGAPAAPSAKPSAE